MAAVPAPSEPVRQPAEADWPAELQLLLGPDGAGILSAAAGAAGGELRSWTPRQVTHQPNRSTIVQYRADLAWPDGHTSSETVVAATGERIPIGAAVLEDGTTRVAVWRWPIDPSLPGLQAALDRDRVAALLDVLGVDGGTVQLRPRAYRPGRRAVIEATGRRGRLFLKVVRPHTVEALHDTHRSLAARLPVPDSLGWTDDGILVLPGLAGRTLRDVMRSGKATLPGPPAIDALLARLPADLSRGTRRRDVLASADHHGSVIADTLPALRATVDSLLADLRAASLADHDLVAVHGDLHEAQLLVEHGRFSGLLDVDTAGAGHRVDDIANLCAHLSVLALVTDRPKLVRRYGAAVLAHAEGRFDHADLRARIAAAAVGLAAGPFRVLEPNWPQATARRLELARAWLDGTHGAR
ncbi:MAG: aminoglycoside phosphotransferase family protein [Acidimicrobiales bacterium]